MRIAEMKNLLLYGNKGIDNLPDWWKYQKAYCSIANFKVRLREHWLLIAWFIFIAVLDGASTTVGLSIGFTEKNTIQQAIMTYSPFLSSGLELTGYSLLALFFIYTGSIKLGYIVSLFAYTLGPAFNLALILLAQSGRIVPY